MPLRHPAVAEDRPTVNAVLRPWLTRLISAACFDDAQPLAVAECDDLDLDELDAELIAIDVETAFDIAVPEHRLSEFVSLDGAVAFVAAALSLRLDQPAPFTLIDASPTSPEGPTR